MTVFVSVISMFVKSMRYEKKCPVYENHSLEEPILKDFPPKESIQWLPYIFIALGFLFLLSRQSQASVLDSWLGISTGPTLENPCSDAGFRETYGRYCSGIFIKEIRCLTNGKQKGVCDSSAVCNPSDHVVKNLCEKYCLNKQSEKLGNQYIQVNCTPRVPEELMIESEFNDIPDFNEDFNKKDYNSRTQEPAQEFSISSMEKNHAHNPKESIMETAYFNSITKSYYPYFWGSPD